MFFKNIHKRERIVLLVVIFCFIIIICKVFYIQVIDYDKLSNLANSLWSRNLPIEADRGRIYTSDGTVIADNLTTVSLVFIPNQITDKEKVAKDILVDKDYINFYVKASLDTCKSRDPKGLYKNYFNLSTKNF